MALKGGNMLENSRLSTDKTPCKECIHEDLCIYSTEHNTTVQDILDFIAMAKSKPNCDLKFIDIISVSCAKFNKKTNHIKEK